jgi:hypothetical protein
LQENFRDDLVGEGQNWVNVAGEMFFQDLPLELELGYRGLESGYLEADFGYPTTSESWREKVHGQGEWNGHGGKANW